MIYKSLDNSMEHYNTRSIYPSCTACLWFDPSTHYQTRQHYQTTYSHLWQTENVTCVIFYHGATVPVNDWVPTTYGAFQDSQDMLSGTSSACLIFKTNLEPIYPGIIPIPPLQHTHNRHRQKENMTYVLQETICVPIMYNAFQDPYGFLLSPLQILDATVP